MDEDRSKYLEKARKICARQESSKRELEQKLRRKGCPADHIHGIIEELEKEGAVDEARFTELFIRDKLDGKWWGKNRIKQGLKEKGIEEGSIQEALDGIEEQKEQRILRKFLSKKWREELQKEKEKPRERTIAAAERKGHSLQLILGFMEGASSPDSLDGIEPGSSISGKEA